MPTASSLTGSTGSPLAVQGTGAAPEPGVSGGHPITSAHDFTSVLDALTDGAARATYAPTAAQPSAATLVAKSGTAVPARPTTVAPASGALDPATTTPDTPEPGGVSSNEAASSIRSGIRVAGKPSSAPTIPFASRMTERQSLADTSGVAAHDDASAAAVMMAIDQPVPMSGSVAVPPAPRDGAVARVVADAPSRIAAPAPETLDSGLPTRSLDEHGASDPPPDGPTDWLPIGAPFASILALARPDAQDASAAPPAPAPDANVIAVGLRSMHEPPSVLLLEATISGSPAMRPEGQVASAAVRLLASSAGHQVTISLSPRELGQVDISIQRHTSGAATVTIAVERAATLELLRHDKAELHAALDRAGLSVAPDAVTLHFRLPSDHEMMVANDGAAAHSANRDGAHQTSPDGIASSNREHPQGQHQNQGRRREGMPGLPAETQATVASADVGTSVHDGIDITA